MPPNSSAHQILLYGSHKELLVTALPFLLDGVRDGDAVVLAVNPPEERAILHAIGDASRIRVIGADNYTDPATAETAMRTFLEDLVEAGAAQIRIVGGLPNGFADHWDSWAEYECAMDTAIQNLPVVAMCVYDRNHMPTEMADHAVRLHPAIALPFGRSEPNPAYAPG